MLTEHVFIFFMIKTLHAEKKCTLNYYIHYNMYDKEADSTVKSL